MPARFALVTLATLALVACAKRAHVSGAPGPAMMPESPAGGAVASGPAAMDYSGGEDVARDGAVSELAPPPPAATAAIAEESMAAPPPEPEMARPSRGRRPRSKAALRAASSDSAEVSSRTADRRALRKARREEPKRSFDRNIQAGTLTAGAFDDTLNWATFSSFMASMTQDARVAQVAERFSGTMTTIRVLDSVGRPVSTAGVELRAGQRKGRTLTTGTDGRAFAISGYDHAAGPLQARLPGQQWAKVRPGSGALELRTQGSAAPVRALDLALVIDATGSMSDELEYLKVEVRSIVAEIKAEFPNVDQRFAVVVYRDEGDEYVAQHFGFSSQLQGFERWLGRQSADGGGDTPEAMDAALELAADLPWRDGPGTARVTFVIADAPPHADRMVATMTAAEELRSRGVAIYPVAASGVDSVTETVMRAQALMSGGQYLFLTDDSGVGNSHAEPHIPCYSVEALRVAMTRMLLSELSGRRVEVDAGRAKRRVGRSDGGVCVPLRRAR